MKELVELIINAYNEALPTDRSYTDMDTRKRVINTPHGELFMRYRKPNNAKFLGILDVWSPRKFKIQIELFVDGTYDRTKLYIKLRFGKEFIQKYVLVVVKDYDFFDDFFVAMKLASV